MSSKKTIEQRGTLALRLTLWYAGIFTLTSCVAFAFFYFLIARVIVERTDQDLSDQARSLSTVLQTRGIEAVKRITILEAQAGGEKKIFFRLLSPTGTTFSSSNMSYWKDIPVSKEAVRSLLTNKKAVTVTISIPERKDQVRTLYAFLGPNVILQLGLSMENYTRVMEAFRKIFILTMGVLVVLSALTGWFMARQALSGVGAVTYTAREISAGDLDRRVPVKERGDEIDQLARTFNHMLDRIQTLITGMREMSDNIAHDLKSPITRIRGMAEVSLTTGAGIDEYEKMAASTVEECDRLLDMINTMLVISKAEAGVTLLYPEPFDFSAIVSAACDLFQSTAEDRGVALSFTGREPCRVRADVRMVQRMVSNLIDNAVKYTQSGGRVDIEVASCGNPPDEVTLRISDTGAGIPLEEQEHIFERFYRCDPSRSRTGTGLGLSLARTIARSHGGDISVSSLTGEGSTFTVRLPSNRKGNCDSH